MEIKGWKYYNHAAIPTTAPHEPVNTAPLENDTIWTLTGANGRTPVLARWITDFDCDHETNWWYVIKDTPLDINALKAKRRYEINKGVKNFDVRLINPVEHVQALCEVAFAAYEEYPAAYRPNVTKEEFTQNVQSWNYYKNYGVFDRETGQLCGYALLHKDRQYVDFAVMKAIPATERKGINAALVNGVLEDHREFLMTDGYICDGSRSINHETAFQDYLEKYFGFRKAYCKMHIRYKGILALVIKCLYPFQKLLLRLDKISIIHLVNSLLKMEEMTAKREKNHE